MKLVPEWTFDKMALHSVDFWLQSEDLPRPENRIRYDGDRVVLEVEENNMEALHRLRAKLQGLVAHMGGFPALLERRLDLGKGVPISGTAHRRPPCWTSTAARTRSTTCTWRMRASSRPSAP